jgi:PAS domain S-box-containing protein
MRLSPDCGQGLGFDKLWPQAWAADKTDILQILLNPQSRKVRIGSFDLDYTPICKEDGSAGGVLLFVQDITEDLERRRNEELVKQVNHVARLGYIDLNIVTNQVMLSDEALEILGLPNGSNRMVHKELVRCVHPEDMESVGKSLEGAIAGRTLHDMDHRMVRPDGNVVYVRATAHLFRDPDGKPVRLLGTIHDITERTQAQEALQDREQRLRLALEASRAGSWMRDVRAERVDWDDRFREIYGFTRDEPSSFEKFLSRVHEADLPQVIQLVNQIDQTKTPDGFDITFRIVRPDGTVSWIQSLGQAHRDNQGQVTRFTGLELDITSRKQAEEALSDIVARQSSQNEAFQAAMSGEPLSTSLGILVRSAIQSFNGKARAAFYSFHDNDVTLTHLVGMSDEYARDVDGFKIGAGSLPFELAMVRREPVITPDVKNAPEWQPWLWMAEKHDYRACWSFPVCTKEGPTLGIFALYFSEPRHPTPRDYELVRGLTHAATILISRDKEASEHARAEQSLREAQERVQRWNVELENAVRLKTAELTQSEQRLRVLATELNLAEQRQRERLAIELHDHLQQMLVLGKLKLGQGERRADSASGQIMKETENILSDALAYTHSLVAELSPPVLRLSGLAAGLKWLGAYMNKYNTDVVVSIPPGGEPPLPDDQVTLLFQSVRELLINSSKYAGTGRAEVSMEDKNGVLVITVCDEGKGVDLTSIGAPDFPSADMSSKFGLFSIRERMKALGGTFEFESSPGKGTIATLILPLNNTHDTSTEKSQSMTEPTLQESPVRSLGGTRPTEFQPNVKSRVLLADDHVMVRQGLRTALESYSDIEVIGEARDGREAIELADRLMPEVIIMDVNMPNLNGIDATIEIKSRHPGMKIVGLSVNADGATIRDMINAGGEKLLTKGAALNELYHAIRETLST